MAVTVVDNGDGTFTITGDGIVDNGDGTFTAQGAGITDNGDGTFTATTSAPPPTAPVAGSIERAVFRSGAWDVYWSAPGAAPTIALNTPIASFTALQRQPGAPVDFDGSASFESGTSIITWIWDFGDGSANASTTSPTVTHTYIKPGTYSIVLTVVDSAGRKAQTTRAVSVVVDVLPVASFVYDLTDLVLSVDATASGDPDGEIASYDWDFGDGAIANGVVATHAYEFGGAYSVNLKVTDNLGATAMTTQTVVPNYQPQAFFTYITSGLTLTVDASSSVDPDPIRQYAWDFGDGFTTTGIKVSHTYHTAGSYSVFLTITDATGHSDTITNSVSVSTIVVPEPPLVSFTKTVTNLTASFNASGTTDVDSFITSYAWLFGDGHTGTGITTSHTYSVGGTYTVRLTATDNLGMSASVSHSVTVSAPAPVGASETTSFPYQDRNRRQVIADDDYDPDISWQHHRDRGSLGGVDHNAPYGTPLYANCSGKVFLTGLSDGGTGGRTLTLFLGRTGWYDQYMHLSSFAVSDGETVSQGQLVGHSGASGDGIDYFYAPHFHLHRYTPGGTRVNAWHYFAGPGTSDSRNIKPGLIQVTLSTGVPNLAFWRRLQWYAGLNGYAYPCDGYMSIPAWKGVQRGLRNYGYGGSIDGVPGSETYKALQRMAHQYGSTSAIDGSLSTADYVGVSKRLNLL